MAASDKRINHKWILKRRPEGAFRAEDLALEEETIDLASCEDDEVIVDVDMLAVDAFLRTMMDEKAYHGALALGDQMPAFGIGTVVASGKTAGYTIGRKVFGMLGARSLARVKAKGETAPMPVLPIPGVPAKMYLSLLAPATGMTAWVGINKVAGPPRRGETVVVSAAAGGTGSIAAQLAKATGARVIGVAGRTKKTEFLTQTLGLDGAVDYKSTESTMGEQLDKLCPDGVDFFFDLAGGQILDEVLNRINKNGRIIICGAASQYSGNLNVGKVEGPSNYLKLAENGAMMKGFNVMFYLSSFPQGMASLLWSWARGYVTIHEHVEDGIDKFAVAMEKMFSGGHMGKLLVDVKPQPEKGS